MQSNAPEGLPSTAVGPDPQSTGPREVASCLCVDLDGTLVRTDTLLESLFALLRVKPWGLFQIIFWVFFGKARCKQKIGQASALQPDSLPYTGPVLDYLQSESRKGRKLLLVTGADASIAIPVARHLGLFSDVICSDGRENVTGKVKLAAIHRVLGSEGFSYAGNSRRDLAVWKGAKSAVIVGGGAGVRKAVERAGVPIERVIPRPHFSIRLMLRALRVHQWTKNLLVLLPIALAHHLLEKQFIVLGIRAFFAFSFCASAVYLINDLWDLPTDRRHPVKRHRPLASGDLSIPVAVSWSAVLLTGAALLNPAPEAALLLLAYVVAAIAYSLYLKRLLLVDVILLAGFYTLRLLYGGAAAGVTVSIWTLAFSMFMFLSLALIKRISELRSRVSEEGLTASGRAYLMNDVSQLSALCSASGCASALVIILYVHSPEVTPLYSRPYFLLGIFPLLVYWQSRLLILANRGSIHEDPVVFSLFDRASRAVALTIFLLVLAAI